LSCFLFPETGGIPPVIPAPTEDNKMIKITDMIFITFLM